MTAHDILPLNMLQAGARADVVDVVGLPEQVRRVQELGIHTGVRIDMLQGGSPCICRLGNQTLCLRGNELLNVLVRLVG
ncbi:MAG: FeoA domain-containing protein [Pirellulales bacterium]|nr:FeoA domain-containing protein [Pirellulales bacterium]